MTTFCTTLASPIGPLLLFGDGHALTGIFMEEQRPRPVLAAGCVEGAKPFRAALEQLSEYFAGKRTSFDLPLAPAGTPFQQQVWSALREIPFGETTTYGALAAKLGRPAASRAVGAANGRNPLSIVVPCHRVVGSTGELTGYAGGLARKRWLLEHEALHKTKGRDRSPIAAPVREQILRRAR